MSHPDPTFTQYFDIGHGYFVQHQWAEAAHYFRAALKLAPDHFQARLLLADSILHLDQPEEALPLAEKAFQENPKPARPHLVRALVARAQQLYNLKNEDEALALCDRALELSPNHGPAFKLRLSIWVRRGDTALLHDNLETAAHAYRQAGDPQRADHIQTLYRWQAQATLERQARACELQERWAEAAEIYKRLIALSVEAEVKHSWETALERCYEEAELFEIYIRGLKALELHDWQGAQTAFLALLNRRLDYRQDPQWATELLDQAVKAGSSLFIPSLPTLSPIKLAPVPLTPENARRTIRLLRLGLGRLGRLAVSPDGRTLAIATSVGVYFYNTASLTKIRTLDIDAWVRCVAFSPDSETLAMGLQDGTVWLWRVPDGTLLRKLRGHSRMVNEVAFSPNGEILASGSDDGFVHLWNPAAGKTLEVLEGRVEAVKSLAFSPQPALRVSGVRCQVSGGEGARRVEGPALSRVEGLALLAIAGIDQTVRLRRIPGGNLDARLEGHHGLVRRVAFSPTRNHLASGADDGIKIWDTQTNALLHELASPPGAIKELLYSPDGQLLAAGTSEGALHVWRANDYLRIQAIREQAGKLNGLAFSAQGDQLISTAADTALRVWNPTSGDLLQTVPGFSGTIRSLDFSPDGSLLAAGMSQGMLALWSVVDSRLLNMLEASDAPLLAVKFSPDGLLLAGAAHDGTVKIWRRFDHSLIHSLPPEESALISLAFSPDSKTLATGSAFGAVRLWDTSRGVRIRTIQAIALPAKGLAFLMGGAMLLVANEAGTFQIWRTANGDLLQNIDSVTRRIRSLTLTPNASTLFYGDEEGLIWKWNLATWEHLVIHEAHPVGVTGMAASPTSTLLASGDQLGRIRLWNHSQSKLLHILSGHEGEITSLTFSPDGTLLASAATDGIIRLWGVVGK